jgi:hypothetical protein
MFVDASFPYGASDDFVDDASGAILADGGPLTGKTFTDGEFAADPISVPYGSGGTVVAIVVYIDTGNSATSRLVAYLDSGVAGLPFATTGAAVNVTWPAGYILKI